MGLKAHHLTGYTTDNLTGLKAIMQQSTKPFN
jgi:hypothetical protein